MRFLEQRIYYYVLVSVAPEFWFWKKEIPSNALCSINRRILFYRFRSKDKNESWVLDIRYFTTDTKSMYVNANFKKCNLQRPSVHQQSSHRLHAYGHHQPVRVHLSFYGCAQNECEAK